MQSVDIDTSQTNLLIKLPCGTIRRVRYQHQDPFPVSRLQDAIECEMGFPSEIYQLKYGDQWLLANTSNKMMVRNGALVQLILKAEWKLLYESVLDKATDLTAVLQICNLDVSADQSDTATSHERRHDPQDFLRSTLPDSGLKTSDSCSDNTQVDSFRLFVAVCLLCRTRQPDLILLEQLLHGVDQPSPVPFSPSSVDRQQQPGGHTLLSQRTKFNRSVFDMIRLAAGSRNPHNSNLAILMLNLEKNALTALRDKQKLDSKRCRTAVICRQSVVRLSPDASQLMLETPSRDRVKAANLASSMLKNGERMTSTRSQSARYYRTKYHHVYDNDPTDASLPAPRPPTAGPRYRPWKTWLNQTSTEQQHQPKISPSAKCDTGTQEAFDTWLKRKRRQEIESLQRLEESQASQNGGDPDEVAKTSAANAAFLHQFLERQRQKLLRSSTEHNAAVDTVADDAQLTKTKKVKTLVRDDSATVRSKQTRSAAESIDSRRAANSRVGVFEIGFHEDHTGPHNVRSVDVDANSFISNYSKWLSDKQHFNDSATAHLRTEIRQWTDLEGIRKKLLLEGMTYEEWLAYKDMARHISRPSRSARSQMTATA